MISANLECWLKNNRLFLKGSGDYRVLCNRLKIILIIIFIFLDYFP